MSAVVRLAARLPGNDETNGIDRIAGSLIDHPTRLRYGIVVFTTSKITTNVELDVQLPTIEIERFEYVGDTDSVPEAIVDELLRAAQSRLGHQPLPFDETDPQKVTVTYDEDRNDQVLPDDEG